MGWAPTSQAGLWISVLTRPPSSWGGAQALPCYLSVFLIWNIETLCRMVLEVITSQVDLFL